MGIHSVVVNLPGSFNFPITEDEKLSELLQCLTEEDEREYELREEHIAFLFRGLHSLAPRWYGLCLQLDVRELDQIQTNGTSIDDCLVLGLQSWLTGVSISWKNLIRAVYQPAGGDNQRLAHKIAHSFKEFCSFKPSKVALSASADNINDTYEDHNTAVRKLQELLESKLAARWYQLGVTLGVRVSDLEMIRLEKLPPIESERKMLETWLRNSENTTWQWLVDSVAHVAGGHHLRLAKTLADRHPFISPPL